MAISNLTQRQTILAFLLAAYAVLLIAGVSYFGGFLPAKFIRRVDKYMFKVHNDNQNNPWKEILENTMLSLSDQQLVFGLAVLVAGFCEMVRENLSLYHWNMIVYLAWLSSSVHIASLTMLREMPKQSKKFRNIRVIGMLVLWALLVAASWPTRRSSEARLLRVPVRCLWSMRVWTQEETRPFLGNLNFSWLLSLLMLFGTYVWKLLQLFSSSDGWVRKYIRAKPEATMERTMRRLARPDARAVWLRWPARKLVTVVYVIFVSSAEVAESFVACLMYLAFALPWGILNLFHNHAKIGHETRHGEAILTFGQLIPLFLLVLPLLELIESAIFSKCKLHAFRPSKFESSSEPSTPDVLKQQDRERSQKGYKNLTAALLANVPNSESKLPKDGESRPHDPVVDHVTEAYAFKVLTWVFLLGCAGVSLAILAVGPVWDIIPEHDTISDSDNRGSRAPYMVTGLIGALFTWFAFAAFITLCSRKLN